MLLSTKNTLVPLFRYLKLTNRHVTELFLIQRCPFSLHMALIRQLKCGGKRDNDVYGLSTSQLKMSTNISWIGQPYPLTTKTTIQKM